MNQQQKHHQTYKETDVDWRGFAGACVLFPLLYLIGPLVLLLGLLIQYGAASSIWKAPDRWASIRTFAWLCPLLYIPAWLFRVQIALFWSAHLPGQFLLWPPTFDGLLARWVLALPLAPALTFLLEQQRPRTLTMRYMVRRPRAGESIGPFQETEPQALPIQQKPAETARRTKASENTATKEKAASSTRKKTARDPRPVGTAWAEQEAEEQQKKGAEQPKRPAAASTPPTTPPRSAGGRKVVEPEADETVEPDPFKAKKFFDWNNVKE